MSQNIERPDGESMPQMGEKPDGENMPQDTTTDESGTSTKGIKAGGGMYLNGGTYQFPSRRGAAGNRSAPQSFHTP